MEILVNYSSYGFDFSDFGTAKLKENNITDYEDGIEIRTNPEVIKLFEKYGDELFNERSDVELEIIPDNITDFAIVENDGYETLFYVLDGKIHY